MLGLAPSPLPPPKGVDDRLGPRATCGGRGGKTEYDAGTVAAPICCPVEISRRVNRERRKGHPAVGSAGKVVEDLLRPSGRRRDGPYQFENDAFVGRSASGCAVQIARAVGDQPRKRLAAVEGRVRKSVGYKFARGEDRDGKKECGCGDR